MTSKNKEKFMRRGGFTLIEILTTIVIIGVLATAAVPIGQLMIIRQQEKLLKEALSETRRALDQFYEHYKTFPASFMELRGLAPPNFTVSYLRDAPPVNPFTGDQYDWVIVTSGVTEYNDFGCYETGCHEFIDHNRRVFQNEADLDPSGNPNPANPLAGKAKCCDSCTGYWGIWDIKYPRDDRLAINETLYKDW